MSAEWRYFAVAIDGSAPAPSGIVRLIGHDLVDGVIGAVTPDQSGVGRLTEIYPYTYLTELSAQGRIRQFRMPQPIRLDWMALTLRPGLKQELLARLAPENIWLSEVMVIQDAFDGVDVGLATATHLEAVRKRWSGTLIDYSNTQAEHLVRAIVGNDLASKEVALSEIERVTTLATYCANPENAYSAWLRLGLVKRHRAQLAGLQRLYALAIQPFFHITQDEFARDISALFDVFSSNTQNKRAAIERRYEARDKFRTPADIKPLFFELLQAPLEPQASSESNPPSPPASVSLRPNKEHPDKDK